MQLVTEQGPPILAGFQSSSGQKAGCNPLSRVFRVNAKPVSILIPPEGRMQPGRRKSDAGLLRGFNPHPARRPDATIVLFDIFAAEGWFQSSSGQKAGCNVSVRGLKRVQSQVSILIRPEGRMQLDAVGPALRPQDVSILIRPEGRMQRGGVRKSWSAGGFNPHPARRPDATFGRQRHPGRRGSVSILIRPEGRMQPAI